MITAVIIGRQLTLRIIGAAEFSTPDHQGIFEEPTLLEIGDQGSRCLVGFLALISNAPGEASVLIPALMEELNETDSTLGQPSGQQPIGGEGAGLFGIVSMSLKVASLSPLKSMTSGTELCMRKASHTGRCGWRFLDRVLATSARFLLQGVEHATTLALADALGIVQVEHRIAPGTRTP